MEGNSPIEVDVALSAWPRFAARLEYFRTALVSVRKHLVDAYPQISFRLLSTYEVDSPADLRRMWEACCREHSVEAIPHEGPPSLGGSLNLLFSRVTAPYALYLQEDFCIKRLPHFIDDLAFLEHNPDFGSLRYSFRRVTAEHRTLLRVGNDRLGDLWELSPAAVNYYSDHPHLRRRTLFATVGPYRTDGNARCELDMNARMKQLSSQGHPSRIAGRGPGYGLVLHIGTTSSMPEKYAGFKHRPHPAPPADFRS